MGGAKALSGQASSILNLLAKGRGHYFSLLKQGPSLQPSYLYHRCNSFQSKPLALLAERKSTSTGPALTPFEFFKDSQDLICTFSSAQETRKMDEVWPKIPKSSWDAAMGHISNATAQKGVTREEAHTNQKFL